MIAAYFALLFAARQPPPFVDYPDWVFQGVLLHGVLSGHPVAGYALKHYPVPNSLTTVALGVLDLILPWALAARLWICLYLLLGLFASWRLTAACNCSDWRLIVTLPVLFLNLDFWYGHTSFEIGLCLLLLLASSLLRGSSRATLSLLLVLLFFTHMEACACALLLLLLWAWRSRAPKLLWATLPTLALTGWYAAARYLSGNPDGRSAASGVYPYASPAFFVYKLNTFLKPFGYVNACLPDGSSQSAVLFGAPAFLLLAGGAVLFAVLILWFVLRRPVVFAPAGALRFFVYGALLLAALLPQMLLGVADPGSRLVLAAAAIAFFSAQWRSRLGTVIAAGSILFCLVNVWQFARIEQGPARAGTRAHLPHIALAFAHVEPAVRLGFYRKLERSDLTGPIFETGLFRLAPK